MLPTRVLGKTGLQVSVFGLGTGPIGFNAVPFEQGVEVVRRAAELGVTYFDTAHFYESERQVGEGLRGYRDRVVLATKTTKRNYEAAWNDLRQSLRDLQTDHLDILYMHCVNTMGDLDAVLAKGGSLECAIEAQRQGLVCFIGISGHARPNILALALERFPFDVVLVAMGAMDSLVSAPEHFFLPAARRAGCGVAAMKVLGAGRLAALPAVAQRYALELGAHTAVVGVATIAELELQVEAARDPRPLTPEEREALLALARANLHGKENPPTWLADTEVIAYRPDWVGAAR